MKLTETEKYMLAGASGVAAERLSEYYARKYVGMPLWAFFAVSFGIYFGTHAIGSGISKWIDPEHGVKRYRETSDEIYQQFNLVRQITDPVSSRTDQTSLMTKAGIVLDAFADTLGNPFGWDPLPGF